MVCLVIGFRQSTRCMVPRWHKEQCSSYIREHFPRVGVTETHPKALLVALTMEQGDTFCNHFCVDWSSAERPEHERDALISAVAAREGLGGQWPSDLTERRWPSEQDPSESWLGPVHYYWPHHQ